MAPLRSLFFGTPEIARHHLACLLDDQQFDVVGVVTQPDRPAGRQLKLTPSPVKSLAEQKGIPVYTPASTRDPVFLQTIREQKAEVVIVVAFGQILPAAFLEIFPRRVVNVHASLLPRWRGAAPIQRALMAGDKETGVCLQVMVEKLDAGDVVGCRRLAVEETMTAVDVYEEIQRLGCELLKTELIDYLTGHLSPQPQDESQVTYAHKIMKEEAEINWQHSAVDIVNKIRGLAGGPFAYTWHDGGQLKIHRAEVIPTTAGSGGSPGEVMEVGLNDFTVSCGEGQLRVLEVQPESRARLSAADFLRGRKFPKHQVLGRANMEKER